VAAFGEVRAEVEIAGLNSGGVYRTADGVNPFVSILG
jgi:hypothetical protein